MKKLLKDASLASLGLVVYFMAFFAFLIISVHKILSFMQFSRKHHIPTDQQTDGHTLI